MVPTTKEEVKAICHNLPTLCHKPTLDKKKGKKRKTQSARVCSEHAEIRKTKTDTVSIRVFEL